MNFMTVVKVKRPVFPMILICKIPVKVPLRCLGVKRSRVQIPAARPLFLYRVLDAARRTSILGLLTRMRGSERQQDGSMKRNFERPVVHLSALLLLAGLILASCGGSTTSTTTTTTAGLGYARNGRFHNGILYFTFNSAFGYSLCSLRSLCDFSKFGGFHRSFNEERQKEGHSLY